MSYLDNTILADALKLPNDADGPAILDRIAELLDAAGEKVDKEENAHVSLIKAGAHEQVSVQADGNLVFTLTYPFDHGKETITELTLHPTKARDLMKMDAVEGQMRQSMALIAASTGRTIRELEGMDAVDVNIASACIGFFRVRSRRTGAS